MSDVAMPKPVCPYNGAPCEFKRCIRLQACSYQSSEASPDTNNVEVSKGRCDSDYKGPKQ